MAWEKRQRGGQYYTRSRRVNGQVVREYIGAGVIGELAAEQDAIERRQREEQREAEQKAWEELGALEQPLVVFAEVCDALVWEALKAAGYHNHRGQWRKRRAKKKEGDL